MGICTHFAPKKFAYGDPHMQKCLKKHISDGLFLHNEDVHICSYVRVLGKNISRTHCGYKVGTYRTCD